MSQDFAYQTDPGLNFREAWPAEEFPGAHSHYFRESGCIMTSLWNMIRYYDIPGAAERFPSPWELNEACKAAGAFYDNANIELERLYRVLAVQYLGRGPYEETALRKLLTEGTMCLLRVNGINSRYHYVLPFADEAGAIRCFDPKLGYTELSGYDTIYQIIRFGRS